ncbi:MAG: type IV pilus modification PilV family protein [Polyangiales bacterium]
MRHGARRRRQQGFTLIEVMMALAVMTVGAMGIMALQQATTRGNGSARQMTLATDATRTWLERMHRDSMRWTQPGTSGLTGASGPVYLSNVPNPGEGPSGWFTPVHPDPPADFTESYGFDYQGRDTFDADEMRYCTHLNMRWLDAGDTIQVRARTWWHRRGAGSDEDISDRRRFPDCGRGAEDAVTAALDGGDNRIRAVYATTVVRWHLMP